MDATRYSRQILFAPIGEEGQQKLLKSRVAVVGMGALGTVLANHMVRAGVGYVRIIDRDFVEPSNLQRQMLYDENDAREGLPKAAAAAEKLRTINSGVSVEPVIADLTWHNAESLLSDVDLVLDGTDNFQVRFLINDVCVKHGIPWIYGGGVSAHGMTVTIRPGITPCLRCLFESAPAPGTTQTCDTAGVIGPLIHIVASFQAVEAMKLLVGDRESLRPSMLNISVWDHYLTEVNVAKAKRADCPCCGKREFDYLEPRSGTEPTNLCGRDTVQISPVSDMQLNLDLLESRLSKLGLVERNKFLLRFQIGGQRLVIFPDGRVLVQGTNDPTVARSLYAKYIGS
ncbi:ThiF family adenylyltransferase [Effusibacillus lacus]|uniref:Thiamine biosynthesis protein ThiF n=1 Tax=Effusibacillus lacus TaxID=1348429 RepID=A0A292YRU7_9BACL|nr:ThiF family adenylyltransferase [Effusibacillus lacus]TCS76364.1 adenylyltransferase/sulfurtransferase [Effusibacillus lacus]GAX91906.1 thiamine biosynthesis protein ThiF [Effusibacillus lacus]